MAPSATAERVAETLQHGRCTSPRRVISGILSSPSPSTCSTGWVSCLASGIFAGYLEDQVLVESIEKANLSRDLFTLQFVERAVTKAFPKERDAILGDLVRLLLFDAMVGNNDRHFPFNA